MNTAQMQAMDKITGRVSVINVPVNGDVKFGSFSIVVRSCKARPPEETPENFAFVDVADSYNNEKPLNIFKGWMMSSTPGLNAVEHPIYDVWLLKCIDTNVDKSKLLTAEQLKERDGLPKAPKITERDEYKKPEEVPLAAEDKINENKTKEALAQESIKTNESPAQLSDEMPNQNVETHPLDSIHGEAPLNREPVVGEPQLPSEDLISTDDGAPKSLLNIGGSISETPKEVVSDQNTAEENIVEEPDVQELDLNLSDDETVVEELPVSEDGEISEDDAAIQEPEVLEDVEEEQLIEFTE